MGNTQVVSYGKPMFTLGYMDGGFMDLENSGMTGGFDEGASGEL